MKKAMKMNLKMLGLSAIPMLIYALMFLLRGVAAQSYICTDNQTLQREYNYTFTHGSAQNNLTVAKTERCTFGCDNVTNSCAPNPVQLNAVFGFGVVALIAIAVFIGKKLTGR